MNFDLQVVHLPHNWINFPHEPPEKYKISRAKVKQEDNPFQLSVCSTRKRMTQKQ